MVSKLLQNAVWIPEDNVYLVSTSADEPTVHTYRDGKVLAIKGGLEYALRGGDFIELLEAGRYEERCLTDEDAFDHIAKSLLIQSCDLDWRPISILSFSEIVDLLNVYAGTAAQRAVLEYRYDACTGHPS